MIRLKPSNCIKIKIHFIRNSEKITPIYLPNFFIYNTKNHFMFAFCCYLNNIFLWIFADVIDKKELIEHESNFFMCVYTALCLIFLITFLVQSCILLLLLIQQYPVKLVKITKKLYSNIKSFSRSYKWERKLVTRLKEKLSLYDVIRLVSV